MKKRTDDSDECDFLIFEENDGQRIGLGNVETERSHVTVGNCSNKGGGGYYGKGKVECIEMRNLEKREIRILSYRRDGSRLGL